MSDSELNIPRLRVADSDFEARLSSHLNRDSLTSREVTDSVSRIIDDVKTRGDAAVLDYSRRFDSFEAESVAGLEIGATRLQEALAALNDPQREALVHAAERIRRYHEKQKQSSWHYEESDGTVLGQKIMPLSRVGVYAPGGKANYPSSILMLAIPAQVAGVREIIATVPTRYSEESRLVFAAAALAGVTRLFTIGGAQAIAAMAYGTETVPRVDKITGPGNVYVTEAKKQVYGDVGIDMLAGPSELTIICDGKTDPDWVAMDLFSQAEHDEQAQSILISTDEAFLDAVQSSIDRLLPAMERREIISASLRGRGIFIHAGNEEQAALASNLIAPEHLEVSVEDPQSIVDRIEHAGAIFMGRHSAEALGDYCAGPSHVLPTSGTARFYSALGVYDFQKRSSIINCSPAGASKLATTAAELARNEHLQAHALSAEYRFDPELDPRDE